jgi:cystathionine gamma-synthase
VSGDGPNPASGSPRPLSASTIAVVAGRPDRTPDAPTSVPVVLSSMYVAGGAVEYGRYGNPTWSAFEEAVARLESGAFALAFASGVAAVDAVLSLLGPGAVVAGPDNAYPGTLDLIGERVRAGAIVFRSVDVSDTDAVGRAVEGSDLLWLESPTNPNLDVADVAAAARAAHAAGALLAVDNTFATPMLRTPLRDGADLVVHSATKLLAGHSDVVLGLVAGRDAELHRRLDVHRRRHGAIPGPMETWLALRGLRTLALRVERGQQTAGVLAQRLQAHPAVARVRYPGWGTILSIELAGGPDQADALAASVRIWLHSTSLGGVESNLERRRRWPSEQATVSPGLVRLSVGIEDCEDLWADLESALHTASG